MHVPSRTAQHQADIATTDQVGWLLIASSVSPAPALAVSAIMALNRGSQIHGQFQIFGIFSDVVDCVY